MKDNPTKRPVSTPKGKAAAPPETPAAPNQKAAPRRRRQSATDTDAAPEQPVLPGHLTWSELRTLLTRPIAYHRPFCRIAGGATAGLLLSQAFYWTLIQDQTKPEEDGWFYKTMVEWEEETGLTRTEQETARRQCRQRKLMEEKKKGIPAKLFFRLRKNHVLVALEALMQEGEFPQPSLRQTRKLGSGKAASKVAGLPRATAVSNTTAASSAKTTSSPARETSDVVDSHNLSDDDVLLNRLLNLGAWERKARAAIAANRAEVENRLDLLERGYEVVTPGAWLTKDIDQHYAPTKEMLERELADVESARAAKQRREHEAAATAAAEKERAMQNEDDEIDAFIKSLTKGARQKLEQQARATAPRVMDREPTDTAVLIQMRLILREQFSKVKRSNPDE